jgi:hypothetical protein
VNELQTSVSARFGIEKLSSFQLGLHQRQAHIREKMRFSINKGRAWGLKNVFRLKGQGMQTQCEVNNFSRVTLFSKLNTSLLFSIARIWPICSLQVELKGRAESFLVYGSPRIIDLVM